MSGDTNNQQNKTVSAQLMQNPELLAALQSKLDGLTGINSDYIRSLPQEVKRRVRSLKNLQKRHMKAEVEFHKEFHNLEVKYEKQMSLLAKKRQEIVNGEYEPNEEECEWPEEEDEAEEAAEMSEGQEKTNETPEKLTGIPDFWLTILKSTTPIDQTIEDHDEGILENLIDIRCKLGQNVEEMNFVLEFEFKENEYFTNTVLTKTYKLQNELDEDDPLGYEGPEIISCHGCTIDWKPNMNVTEKTVKKRQKHKGRGTVRTIEKKVLNDSFFNFFNPPEVKENEDLDSDTEALLDSDFQIGSTFKDRLCTRAVLYFTGEAQAAERENDFDDEMFGEDGEDEEDDPDYEPPEGQSPSECQQQ